MKRNQRQFGEVRNPRQRRRGATIVEFALVVPILMVTVLGIIEFGWMAKNQLQLANAVRDGARDAAIGSSTTLISDRVKNRASGIPGSTTDLTITMTRDDGSDANGYAYTTTLGNKAANGSGVVYNDAPSGALIKIQASIPNQPLTGLPFTKNRTLQVNVIMRREANG